MTEVSDIVAELRHLHRDQTWTGDKVAIPWEQVLDIAVRTLELASVRPPHIRSDDESAEDRIQTLARNIRRYDGQATSLGIAVDHKRHTTPRDSGATIACCHSLEKRVDGLVDTVIRLQTSLGYLQESERLRRFNESKGK